MTDKQLLKTLKALDKEIPKRLKGDDWCEDIDLECFKCQARIMQSAVQTWMFILEWESDMKLEKKAKK